MRERQATVVHQSRVNMLANASGICTRQDRCDASLLDFMKARVRSNAMRYFIIELTATCNDGGGYGIVVVRPIVIVRVCVIISILIVMIMVSVDHVGTSTTGYVCLNLFDECLEVGKDGSELEVTILPQEGLRIDIELSDLLIIDVENVGIQIQMLIMGHIGRKQLRNRFKVNKETAFWAIRTISAIQTGNVTTLLIINIDLPLRSRFTKRESRKVDGLSDISIRRVIYDIVNSKDIIYRNFNPASNNLTTKQDETKCESEPKRE